MKTSTLASILFSATVTADVVPAIRRDPTTLPLDKRQLNNPLLGKRQMCDIGYPLTCSSVDGSVACMALDEVCCQWVDPTSSFSFTCDATHPYCCPPDASGQVGCGSDESCGTGGIEQAPTHGLATQTTGVKPTATAQVKTVTAAAQSGGGGTQTTGSGPSKTAAAQPPVKTNAAGQVGMMKGGVAAAVFGVMALL